MASVKNSILAAMLAGVCAAFSGFAAEPAKKDPKDMKADEANEAGLCPVCKGEFKPVYHYEYKGKEYHFKTRDCCKQFTADPTKFGAEGSTWKPAPAAPAPVDDKKKPAPK